MKIKLLFFCLSIFSLIIFVGCGKKMPKQVNIDPRLPKKQTSNTHPEQVIHNYINALRNKNVDEFIDCHCEAQRIEKDSSDYHKLKDAMQHLDVTEYKIIGTKLKLNKIEGTVVLNWTIQYLADNPADNKTFENKGFNIPIVKENGEWFVKPDADLRSWSKVKVSSEKVQDEKEK